MESSVEKQLSQDYENMVNKNNPPSNIVKDCILAFVVGGLICDIGQFVMNMFISFGVPKDDVNSFVATIMVFLGAFLTGLGVYDNIGKYAGAGSIVPITGFANSIVSPAIEFKKEGYVFGVAAKMFIIAGPVLVYGISTSIIVGMLHYFLKFVR
jgi:stage V sporulation protein AC